MDENEKSRLIFEEYPIPKALAAMAIPTIVGQLIILIYSLADTFWVGRTNNTLMVAGASLILPYFNLCISFSGLAGVGGGSLISRLLGIHDEKEAKKVSSFSIYLAIGLSILFSLFTYLFMNPILTVLGASEETIAYARDYAFCVIVLGALPTVLSQTLSNLLRSVGFSKKAGFGITMGGVLNMILDPIFMFLVFPHGMEIIGAGVATLLSNCIACIYFFVVIWRANTSVLTFSLHTGLPSKNSVGQIFNVGVPNSINTLLFDANHIIMDKLMAGYGSASLAAIGIVLKAERLPLNVGMGIATGMMPIVAYNFAARNGKRMKGTISFSRNIGVLFGIVSVILYEIFASQIMRFFINDPETIRLGTTFLRFRAVATPLMYLSFYHCYLFQSFGEGNKSLFLGTIRWIGFNIPMLFLFNYLFGMTGVVMSQVTADIFTVSVSLFLYFRFLKRKVDF